ncbi:MAG: S1C family serine protease [Elusimicrobiota bacterium]
MKIKIISAIFIAGLLASSVHADPLADAMNSLHGLKFAPTKGFNLQPSLRGDQNALVRLVKNAAPGVVTIEVDVTVSGPADALTPPNPFTPLCTLFGCMTPVPSTPEKPIQKSIGDIGSGFVIAKDRAGRPLIVTNAHVVDSLGRGGKAVIDVGGNSVNVSVVSATMTVTSANGTKYTASLMGFSDKTRGYDLALVRLNSPCPSCKILKMGGDSKLASGDTVIAMGAPMGLSNTVTKGIISNPDRQSSGLGGLIGHYIQTDTPINPGNSGGPLINISGHVIGVNEIAITTNGGNMGLNLAIPVRFVKEMYTRYQESGIFNSSDPGLEATMTNAGILEITAVDQNMQSQGLEVSDLIVSVDGRTFRSAENLLRYLSDKIPGHRAIFNVSRNARPVRVSVVMRAMD